MFVLKNCRLIPQLTEGYEKTMGDVLICGDRIREIAEQGHDFNEEVTEVYDLAGKTLMPGLYDLHTHVAATGLGDMVDGGRDEYRTTLDVIQNVQASLKAGFTTLRDSGAEPFVCACVRDAIDEGRIVGPNLTICGRLMSPTELSNHANEYSRKTIHEVDTLDTIRKGVRDEIRDGADYVKYVASGATSLKGSNPFIPIAHYRELECLVKEAAFKGRYVAAHVHGAESIKQCIRAGVKTLEHCSELDDECIALLQAKTSYAILTINVAGSLLEGAELPGFTKHLESEAAARVHRNGVRGIKKAHDAGLVFGFGTDTGMINLFHGKNAKGLVYYVKYGGLAPVEALRHATIDSAEIMNEKEIRGTVKKGKIADLIVIDGDPTIDIERITDSVAMVIKSGKIVSNQFV